METMTPIAESQNSKPKEKMTVEMAEQELKDWLIEKHGNAESVTPDNTDDEKSAKEKKDTLKTFVKCLQSGSLILGSDGTATYKLRHPITVEDKGKEIPTVKELKFKARLKYKNVKSILRSVPSDDSEGRILAYAAGLTGCPMRTLEEMVIGDLSKVQLLVVFFIVD